MLCAVSRQCQDEARGEYARNKQGWQHVAKDGSTLERGCMRRDRRGHQAARLHPECMQGHYQGSVRNMCPRELQMRIYLLTACTIAVSALALQDGARSQQEAHFSRYIATVCQTHHATL